MAGIALMLSAVCMNATCSSNSTTTEGVQLIEGNSTFPAVNPVNDNPQSFIDKRMDFYYFLSCWISILFIMMLDMPFDDIWLLFMNIEITQMEMIHHK